MQEKYKQIINKEPQYEGLERFCNICGYRFAKFKTFNRLHPREAQCPVCGSLERHRHLAIHLFSLYPFLDNKKILHFAPEPILRTILQDSKGEYYDADLNEKKARYKVDITNITFNDNFFDYIICIHVLEHIIDDLKAMSEMYRVLKKGGTAYLDVPVYKTLYEDYSIVLPQEREKAFGQYDHVRRYDLQTFLDRLQSVGFDITISNYRNQASVFQDAKLGDQIILAKKK